MPRFLVATGPWLAQRTDVLNAKFELVLVRPLHGALVIRAGAWIVVIVLGMGRRLVGRSSIGATLAFEGFGPEGLVLGLVGCSIF